MADTATSGACGGVLWGVFIGPVEEPLGSEYIVVGKDVRVAVDRPYVRDDDCSLRDEESFVPIVLETAEVRSASCAVRKWDSVLQWSDAEQLYGWTVDLSQNRRAIGSR